MSGIRFDTSGFRQATKALQDGVKRNTQNYGKVLAQTYEKTAKRDAPWTDRRGNARMKLYGTSAAVGNRVRVEMGGSAPNYKRGALSASDYLEYLEFGHNGKYATVFPTAEAIAADVQRGFGEAALQGKMKVNIVRNRGELAARKRLLQVAAAAGWWQNIAYQNWLAERSVFNR